MNTSSTNGWPTELVPMIPAAGDLLMIDTHYVMQRSALQALVVALSGPLEPAS